MRESLSPLISFDKSQKIKPSLENTVRRMLSELLDRFGFPRNNLRMCSCIWSIAWFSKESYCNQVEGLNLWKSLDFDGTVRATRLTMYLESM